MDVLWKGALGGLMVALITLASKRGNVLPGILPLAPVLLAFSLLAVGAKGSMSGVKTTCLASIKAAPLYFVFLATCWLLIDRVDYRVAVLGAFAAWLCAVVAVFVLPRLL